MKHGEDALQKAVWQYLRVALRDNPAVWATENRNVGPIEGRRRKARGCIAGVPDILILAQGQLYGNELKMPGNYATPTQKSFHVSLEHNGAHVTVCRSVDEVADFIESHGLTKKSQETKKHQHLKACPHCNSEDLQTLFTERETVKGLFHVECWGCWMRGPVGPTMEQAERLWNELATPKTKWVAL